MDVNAQSYIDVLRKLDAPTVIFEKARPGSDPRRDIVFVADATGRPISVHHPLGFHSSHLEIPHQIFNTLLVNGVLAEDQPEDEQGRTIYRMKSTAH